MVSDGAFLCPKCGGQLKHYDSVRRIVRAKGGEIKWTRIRRLLCSKCGANHRELPAYLLPYKQYEADIIKAVVRGEISQYDLDYEDYPCEMTMRRWLKAYSCLYEYSDE